jgi:hypothetical protein
LKHPRHLGELEFLGPALKGFGLGAGLIIAIGAQNAYVLRQGIRREHVLLIATICFLCDATLISIGAAGFGYLVSGVPSLERIAAWGGAAFLAAYGLRAFHSALKPGSLDAGNDGTETPQAGSAWAAAGVTLALSLLNPHCLPGYRGAAGKHRRAVPGSSADVVRCRGRSSPRRSGSMDWDWERAGWRRCSGSRWPGECWIF